MEAQMWECSIIMKKEIKNIVIFIPLPVKVSFSLLLCKLLSASVYSFLYWWHNTSEMGTLHSHLQCPRNYLTPPLGMLFIYLSPSCCSYSHIQNQVQLQDHMFLHFEAEKSSLFNSAPGSLVRYWVKILFWSDTTHSSLKVELSDWTKYVEFYIWKPSKI